MNGDQVPESLEAYASGTRSFMGLELLLEPGVLVPREETELLGRTAIAKLGEPGSKAAPLVVDMCCGSGNLACAIAAARPDARIWACDLTEPCVTLARRNVERLGFSERVHVAQGDLFEAVSSQGFESAVDLVVCNPPYISSGRLVQRSDLAHEPREAFDGGPYGLTIHQRVLKDALAFLRPGGFLLFEFGLGQERQLRILFQRARGYDAPEFLVNEAGEPRVACGRRSIPSS